MIDRFDGEYAFLSNFYDSPITFEGIRYPTVEHFFQAQKTSDLKKRQMIALQATPGKAKRMGRQVELRSDWDRIKNSVMLTGLYLKFSHPILREKLIKTGDEELVEGNWWHDTYWGVCEGVGANNLGRLLMKVRESIQTEKSKTERKK